jgi:D-serine deaminase-like pyridoxal phosphate-dependent protein
MTDVQTRQPIELPVLPEGLDTPALVVFLDRTRDNIARLQAVLDRRGIRGRPHAKTHKSIAVARLQLQAGARGITIGTLGEAEVFLDAGITDLFIAYPIWAAAAKAARLRALQARAPDLRVGVDSAAGAQMLADAVAGSPPLAVLVEIDSGGHRTGVPSTDAATVALAARDAGLDVQGVFTHGGHSYAPGARQAAAVDEVTSLERAADSLEAVGIPCPTLSAGSTPTMSLSATGRVNEIRAGTYVYGDRQQLELGSIDGEGLSAVVAATVVSAAGDRLVLDAGAKSLTKDQASWVVGYGLLPAYPDLVIERLSDYHGVVRAPAGAPRPRVGEVVAVVPNHICPVVDLFATFVAVDSDGSSAVWPVDARGRSA